MKDALNPPKYLLLVVLFGWSCFTKQNEKDEIVAKKTVETFFRLSVKQDIDSLKIITPNISRWKWSNEHLKMKINLVNKVISAEGISSLSESQLNPYNEKDIRICKIKIIPKSPQLIGVDSFVFNFDKYEGADKIASFEIFEPIPNLPQLK